jgi:hypothetical protein
MSKIGAFTLVASTGFITDVVDEGALGRDPRRGVAVCGRSRSGIVATAGSIIAIDNGFREELWSRRSSESSLIPVAT